MGNVPVIHEVATAAMSVGDLVTGNHEAAGRRWGEYSEQSVIGSGVRAAVAGMAGNNEEATRLARGMGKATGSALCGGGLLRDLPGFHELATAGESLGDVIGYQDGERARQRWEEYSEHSVIGTGVRALSAAVNKDMQEAERLGKNMIVPSLNAATSMLALAATAGSAGAASAVIPITGVGVAAAQSSVSSIVSSVVPIAVGCVKASIKREQNSSEYTDIHRGESA